MNIETPRPNGTFYHRVQICASDMRPSKQSGQMEGHFKRAGVATKLYVKKFEVNAPWPWTRLILCVDWFRHQTHFVPGQYVDVTAMRVESSMLQTLLCSPFRP